jgi:group I intron endonuclease
MEQGELYMITNKTNGKKYIGQTVSYLSSGRKYGTSQRWNKHCSDAKRFVNDSKAFCNAIRKYGKDNFTVEILLKCNNKYLNEYEIRYIQLFNTLSPNGYNLDSGGCSQKVLHDETKLKLGKSQRFLNIKDDDLVRIKQSMKEISITELPLGINYTHNSTFYEGFSVKKDNKLKSFISNSHTLTQKLQLALKYFEYYRQNNILGMKSMEDDMIALSKITIRNSKICEEAKEVIRRLDIELDTLPLCIRYEKRKSRFFVYMNNQNKYFTQNNPELSLKEAIEYLERINKSQS